LSIYNAPQRMVRSGNRPVRRWSSGVGIFTKFSFKPCVNLISILESCQCPSEMEKRWDNSNRHKAGSPGGDHSTGEKRNKVILWGLKGSMFIGITTLRGPGLFTALPCLRGGWRAGCRLAGFLSIKLGDGTGIRHINWQCFPGRGSEKEVA
jgi:hypothetical protein